MSDPPAKRRRRELNLSEKIKLIREAESSTKPLKTLAETYGIGKSTVSDIIKKKSNYVAQYEANADSTRQRFKQTLKFQDINSLTWDWFQHAKASKIPISGPLLQEKALLFASILQVPDFKASNGWLESWRSRHNIRSMKISGDFAEVSPEIGDDTLSRLPTLCDGYLPENVYSCDECGFLYRALPDRTLATKKEDCNGGGLSKERFTVIFACSMTGEKVKPVVIGKTAKPQCFGNIDISLLPVTWTSNKNAWMTTSVFASWLKDVNSQMLRKKRKILLFLDNATSHAPDIKLSNITLNFLPANTSRLQPFEKGIIRAFKTSYRKHLLHSVIAKADTRNRVSEVTNSVNVLDAVYMIDRAWNETEEATVTKCFAKAGFPIPTTANDTNDSDEDNLHEIAELITQASQSMGLDDIDPNLYINFDDEVPTEETYSGDWEQQLIDNFIYNRDSIDQAKDEIEVEYLQSTKHNATCTLTYADVLDRMSELQNFALNKDSRYLCYIQEMKIMTEAAIVKERTEAVPTSFK